MRHFVVMSIVSLLLASGEALAKQTPFDGDDGYFLVESCREAVAIYESRDEKRFLAAQMTSVSEAMRAGYCIGVITQYLERGQRCDGARYRQSYGRSWHEMAQDIASYSFGESALLKSIGTKQVLKKAYCGD